MANNNPYFWFSGWNYGDDSKMISSIVTEETVQAAITAAMDTIEIDENGNLVVEGVVVGTVEAGSQITNVTLDDNDNLVITYVVEDGTTKTVTTSLAKLVDVYTGGEGIDVKNNTISINDSEVATQEELDAVQTQVTELKDTAVTSVELSATDGQSYELLVNGEVKGGFTIPSIDGLATTEELTTAKQDLEGEIENCVKEVSLDETDNNVFTLTVDGEEKGGFTLPDTSNLLDKETAAETYQPKGSYVSDVSLDTTDNNVYTLTVDGEEKGGFTLPSTDGLATAESLETTKQELETEITTLSNNITNEIVPAIEGCVKSVSLDVTDNNVYTLKVDGEEKGGFTLPDTSNLLDKETADETYQPKGNYVSEVSLDESDNNVFTLTVDGEAKGGFTLPSTEGLATTDEVNAVSANVESNAGQIATLQAMVDILSAQVKNLGQTNVVAINLSSLIGDLTDEAADYVLSGTLTSTATITGKSITLGETVVVSDDNRLNLKANDVTIDGATISGTYNKSNGNSVIKIDECENVVIQNLTFDESYSGYNGVEISLTQGGTTYPKNILVYGCEIGGTFSNNAINVYATADNATITISNCHFVDVSNCLRISNTTKATGVTFNVVNCTVDQWEHAEGNEAYYGFFLGQDYTSSSDEEVKENNLFGQDKITLNFTNLIHAGEKVCPSDPYSVCGVDDGTQVVYTYADKHGKWYGETDKEMYPVVTFA